MSNSGLLDRLENGENILIAEGYMWEFERRGYLKCGDFIPEVVLEHPELVKQMHEEFVHAGSDVCEAFTYYGNREKLRQIGREEDLEKLNRTALRIARDVSDATGTLMAGGICNTGIYNPDDEDSVNEVTAMYKEQIEWAVEEGADFIIAETLKDYSESLLALRAIQKYGKGLPAVITMTAYVTDKTIDDVPFPETCRKLHDAGAAVVGLNCARGPRTMLPLLQDIRKEYKGPLAALPVPFRCREDCKTFQSLRDPETDKPLYPTELSCVMCSRSDVRSFAEGCKEIGINYLGLCCGNAPFYMREIAQVYGRTPEACKYSPDVSTNILVGEIAKQDRYKRRQKIILSSGFPLSGGN